MLEESSSDLGSTPSPLWGAGRGEGQAGHADFHQGYRNRFTATPWAQVYRPPLRHPKPRVLGSQSAVVTGPAGEEIHCDRHGRIKVQFHWDRDGQADERTSCWLRVASSWAGDRYGGLAIPRVGMEVLVSFLDGDPDQPLVSGCLYHAEHRPPYELPTHKTRSVFKSLSSPGGGGYNELRIEDRKGAEQIYIHAQRDWDQRIEHDQRLRVGHQRHATVEANSYTELKAEEHRTTHGDRKVDTRRDDHLRVGGDQHVKVGNAQLVEAGREIHLSSGLKVVLEAGSELTLRVGGSFLKLDPGGVTLVGPSIRLNAGGSPGQGSGAAAQLPRLPGAADSDLPGELTHHAMPSLLTNCLDKPQPVICEECLKLARQKQQALVAR
ncbi:type VI secretion system Vgr family protein [compost metagenome]